MPVPPCRWGGKKHKGGGAEVAVQLSLFEDRVLVIVPGTRLSGRWVDEADVRAMLRYEGR